MPNPTASDVHVNVPLTNISIAYQNATQNFVADKVFPSVPVDKQGNLYYTYDQDDWFRAEAQLRAPGTETVGGGYHVNTDSYFAAVYGIHKDIDRQIEANADSQFNMDRDATQWVTHQLMLRKEKLWISKFFGTSIWGKDVTGVSGTPSTNQVKQWSVAGSTPIEDLHAYELYVQGLTGYRPNTLVMGAAVWNSLRDHAEFYDRTKYTSADSVSTALLARLLDVDNIYVAGAIEVTTAEDAATDTYSFMLGKHAWLGYVAPNPGVLQPSAGYTFSWTGYLGNSPNGTAITTFDMQHLRSRRVEGEMAFDLKVVAPNLGVFFSGVVA